MLMTVLSKALIRMFKQMKDFIIENQDLIKILNIQNPCL